MLTQQVPLMKQDSITLPDHLCLALVFSGVCVTQSLILVCSVLWTILCHCNIYPYSIYGFWLPLWDVSDMHL